MEVLNAVGSEGRLISELESDLELSDHRTAAHHSEGQDSTKGNKRTSRLL